MEINTRLDQILEEIDGLKKEIKATRDKLARYEIKEITERSKIVRGIKVVSARVDASDSDELRHFGDLIKEKIGSGIILLGNVLPQKKVILLIMITNDLVKKGFDAVKIIDSLAPYVGGKGGGKNSLAQAGGTKIEGLNQALEKIYEIV